MLRKIVGVILLLAIIFLFDSCIKKTDKYSKKDKSKPVDLVTVQIQALQDSVVNLHNKVQSFTIHAENLSAKCDSVVEENLALQTENNKLRAQLTQARKEVIPNMRQQYENIYFQQQTAVEDRNRKIKLLKIKNLNLSNDNGSLHGDIDLLQAKLNNLEPWVSKWQKDSKRGFIKVLFGVGKAPVPDVPIPQLE